MSTLIGIAVYIYFESLACGIASFLSGVFLDVDHIFDGYINYGLRFKLWDIFHYCKEIKFKRITLLFHSYELIFILWAAIFIFPLGNIAKAVAIGATQHLIFDQLTNVKLVRMEWLGYFLTFRLMGKFAKERIYKGP